MESGADCFAKQTALPLNASHCCELCSPHVSFATNKALLAHKRIRHKVRSDMRLYIHADNRCPVCGHLFASRLRAIAHLSEDRKLGKATFVCSDRLADCPRLSAEALLELDAQDRKTRAKAAKLGHSTPRVAVHSGRSTLRGCKDTSLSGNSFGQRKARKRVADVLYSVPLSVPIVQIDPIVVHKRRRLRSKTSPNLISSD